MATAAVHSSPATAELAMTLLTRFYSVNGYERVSNSHNRLLPNPVKSLIVILSTQFTCTDSANEKEFTDHDKPLVQICRPHTYTP